MVLPPWDFELPYVTVELPGIGGVLRATPQHFIVDEIPLYDASGVGDHLYLNLTKSNMTTRDVVFGLERLLKLGRATIGYAGLKDKNALTTQTFSVPIPSAAYADVIAAQVESGLNVRVNWARRHRNKLKAGHLLGNHFQIVVTDLNLPAAQALARTTQIVDRLQTTGVPNFFGPQRFGGQGDNAASGLEILLGSRTQRDRWLRRFLVSSYQSYLCNVYLTQRLAMGAFHGLLTGDVAKKHDTGGIFLVEDLTIEQPRYAAHEISFTAPIFGSKMRRASGDAGRLEDAITAETGITDRQWAAAHTEGTRRTGRLLLSDLHFSQHSDGIRIDFSLPKGGFATTVMREIMKLPGDALPAEEIEIE
jgi:tRNA pseudouridine13 synthase